MKKNNPLDIYITLGKVLCGIAGGIVGFFTAGVLLIVPGMLLGVVFASLFKRSILSNSFKNT